MHIHSNQEDIIREEGLDIFVIKRKRVGKAHGNCQTIFKCAKMGKSKDVFKPKESLFCIKQDSMHMHMPLPCCYPLFDRNYL